MTFEEIMKYTNGGLYYTVSIISESDTGTIHSYYYSKHDKHLADGHLTDLINEGYKNVTFSEQNIKVFKNGKEQREEDY